MSTTICATTPSTPLVVSHKSLLKGVVRRRLSLFGCLRRSCVCRHNLPIAPSQNAGQVHDMIAKLTAEEIEEAARTNYVYFQTGDPHLKRISAQHMAARYLRSKKDPELALQKMKETLDFRRQINVDSLRLAFSQRNDEDASNEEGSILRSHLMTKSAYVQGLDVDGRATFIFEPHKVESYCAEWSIKQHVWTLEKAIACTKSPDKTINAVINCSQFSFHQHAPPTYLAKDFLKLLRNHYTGHVNKIFLVDPPGSIRTLWSMLKPFVSERTKGNVVFVTRRNKEDVFGPYFSLDQAKPWMLDGGKQPQDFDFEEYLSAPFDVMIAT